MIIYHYFNRIDDEEIEVESDNLKQGITISIGSSYDSFPITLYKDEAIKLANKILENFQPNN